MASKGRSPEDWISFLLTVIDNIPARPDWNKIAADTGAYKSGKFVNQAYANLRKKHQPLPNINDTTSSVPATPKSTKKRAAATELPEDDEEQEEKPKRSSRKVKKTPKKEDLKDESDGARAEIVNAEESDDELSGNVTIGGYEDEDED